MLVERQGRAGIRGAHQRGGAQNQIGGAGIEIAGERAGERQREAGRGSGRDLDPVADRGEGDEAVEQVIAVGAAAGDMQSEIDLGRRELGRHQPSEAGLGSGLPAFSSIST